MTADRTPTPEQRATWQRLADEATPAPWFTATADNEAGDDPDTVQAANSHGSVVSDLEPCGSPRYLARVWADGPRPEADQQFIAAAREAVPALLSSLAAAEERARRAEGERDEARLDSHDDNASKRFALRERDEARSERDALAARLAVQAVNLKATIFRLDRAASALLAMVSRQHHLPGSPAEWRNAIDNLRATLASSGSAPVAPARDARDAVISALYRSCPFSPDTGCRRCRVCDAAERVAALAPVAPEGRETECACGHRAHAPYRCGVQIITPGREAETLPACRCTGAAPETPAPTGEPVTDPKRWHLCRHDILRSDCAECRAPAAAPAKEDEP
jgi:hypothetical protein